MNNRPIVYTSACVLSFIGGGIAVLSYLFTAIFYNSVSEFVISITNDLSMQNTSRFYFTLLAIAHFVSLLSVFGLWRYWRKSFFLYIVSQLSIIFLPVIFIGKNSFSMINFVFAILFSTIYFFYYRWIKNKFKVSI